MLRNYDINLIEDNIYELNSTVFNHTIRFKVESPLYKKINLLSKDMSDDGVIFIPELYPTPTDDNYSIIGRAMLYNNGKYIDEGLVDLKIIESNISEDRALSIATGFFM